MPSASELGTFLQRRRRWFFRALPLAALTCLFLNAIQGVRDGAFRTSSKRHLRGVAAGKKGVEYLLGQRLQARHRAGGVYQSLLDNGGNRTAAAMLFFTHLRRTAGTTLEDHVMLPIVGAHNGSDGGMKPLLCMENFHGRFYDMTTDQRRDLRRKLEMSFFQWRHCPYGLHELIGEGRPYTYMTMLRRPQSRMKSWWHFCIDASRTVCQSFSLPSTSRKSAPFLSLPKFYTRRHDLLTAYEALPPDAPRKQLAPPNNQKFMALWTPPVLEFRLDDNNQVRMLCGPEAHNHPLGVNETHLACAMGHLLDSYSFVGIQERFDESLCLLTTYLGLPLDQVRQRIVLRRHPATKYSDKDDDDVETDVMASYHRLDDVLYEFGNALLDYDLLAHPECRRVVGAAANRTAATPGGPSPPPLPSRDQVLERLGRFASYLFPEERTQPLVVVVDKKQHSYRSPTL